MAMKRLKLALGLGLLGGCALAQAQTGHLRPEVILPAGEAAYLRPAYRFPARPPQDGPASVQMGSSPVFVTPFLGFAAGRDDNILYSSRDERSSSLYILSPAVKLDARDENKVLQLSYEGQIGRYGQSKADNYVDHTALAQFDVAFDRRNFLRLGADYIRGHDPRGATDRTLTGSPDKYRLSGPSATYAFGAPGAQGRLELYFSDIQRRYTNNRAFTEASDRDTQDFGGTLYLRMLPRTYALADVRRTNID
jgi:polysaccharide biosynthesis protein VpsM